MSDEAGSVSVIFNGEIYNFRQLRTQLEGLGHMFRTRSDTEVIIHGYRQWGTEVFNRLNGMFGLAIWDKERRRLILARDSAGIKLVYYRVADGTVVFGSELRAVLSALESRPEIDPDAVNDFLRYRYTPSPRTIYRGVSKLAPGTMAVFEPGRWRIERWYRMDPKPELPVGDGEKIEALLDLYKDALQRHLISDVPLGLLLSGGVDSGLLLGLMSLHGDRWQTYTVGYGRTAYEDDELADAARTAALFGARHNEVQLSRQDFEVALPRIVSVIEEPIAASSIVPMYFVCERARQDVKVALMGQGPDELFGGYVRHLGVRYGENWRRLPRPLRAAVEAAIDRLPRSETLKRGAYALSIADRLERSQRIFSIVPGDVVDGLFRDGLRSAGSEACMRSRWAELDAEMSSTDDLGAFQVIEVRCSLPDELLMYADKLSMAHGLEVRVPYLDREIVEFARALPGLFKIRHFKRKWIHRLACKRFLPREVLRRRKRGFAVDAVGQWFDGSVASKLNTYLLDESSLMFRILRADSVRRLLDEHQARRRDNHKILFSLVLFEEWMRNSVSAG